MCGFIGLYDRKGLWSNKPLPLDLIETRGPDDRGEWSNDKGLRLGHTRLSVIDLDAGQQPMVDETLKLAIIFNGEIYNFQSLREELLGLGHTFKTHSDTEVLLKAYASWGEAMCAKLDGMFAFVLYDMKSEQLLLARDRCGIKPLFYKSDQDGMMMSSTLLPIMEMSGGNNKLNSIGVRDYLAFQTTLSPDSFVEGVSQLEPAHYMVYNMNSGDFSLKKYWQIASDETNFSVDEMLEQTESALRSSVQSQMVSDIPIGSFLSGGIDSSLMVHYMSQFSSTPINTFSMRFSEKSYDESFAVKDMVQAYQTNHTFIEAPDMNAELLERALSCLDQPLADPAYISTWYLSKETKKSVSVVMSGDGGDELFGGYDRYSNISQLRPQTILRHLGKGLLDAGVLPGALTSHVLSEDAYLRYKKVELGPYRNSRKDFYRYLNPDLVDQMEVSKTLDKWMQLVAQLGGSDQRKTFLKADLWTYLSDNCLMKTDRASMSWGLEVRVPILSNSLIDFAYRLPEEHLFEGRKGKMPLLKLAKKHLPESVWNRPKHGFSVPLGNLFKGPWRDYCESILIQAERELPIFKHKSIRVLWESIMNDGKASRRLMYTFLVLFVYLLKKKRYFQL